MEIIRKTNVLIKTARKFVVHQSETIERIWCGQCDGHMVRAQMSADLFGVSSREIYRLIEREEIHFVETQANEIYVCPISIKNILETMN